MSIIIFRSVSCDGPDCPEWIYQSDEQPGTLRKNARHEGWKRARLTRPGQRPFVGDLCPDCAVKAAAMKEPGRIIPPMRLDELERVCRESREGGA